MNRKLLEKIYQKANEETKPWRDAGVNALGGEFIPLPKSKEQIYEELKNVPTNDDMEFGDNYPIRQKLQEQIESQYRVPKSERNINDLNVLKTHDLWNQSEIQDILNQLSDNLEVKNIKITPSEISNSNQSVLPKYLLKGEEYPINKLPKESNPNSFTSFLGRFDPFKNEVPLSEEERKNVPIVYQPRGIAGTAEDDALSRALVDLGKVKDFQQQRLSIEPSLDEQDPRILNARLLGINPKTLDEMIEEAPINPKIRFHKLYEKLKKQVK